MNDTVGIAEAVASRHRELAGVLEATQPDIVSADSQLPGWSRLNIVCHLRYGAQASHRMTSDAQAGQPAAFYPGGRSAQRPSTLHPGPQESPADVVQSLIEASAALDELWAQIPPEAWDGTTVHEPEDNPDIGPITLLQLAILRLTEVEVHGTDLDLGLSDWSDPFIDAALPMRIAWLPRRHTPSQAPSGSWNLVATDGPSFNVAVSQGVVSASPGKACQADATISGPKADLLGLLLGRVDVADLDIAGDETTARRFATTSPPP